MAKIKATPQLIHDILARVPEGFIRESTLNRVIAIRQNGVFVGAIAESGMGHVSKFFYDPARTDRERVMEMKVWCQPDVPLMNADGDVLGPTISAQLQARRERFPQNGENAAARRLLERLAEAQGFATSDTLCLDAEDVKALEMLLDKGVLVQTKHHVYDPLRLSRSTAENLPKTQAMLRLRDEVSAYLRERPGGAEAASVLEEKFGVTVTQDVLSVGGFTGFGVNVPGTNDRQVWFRLNEKSHREAEAVAREAVRIDDSAWDEALAASGNVLRPGASDGANKRAMVLARSYSFKQATQRLGVRDSALHAAAREGRISVFTDPEGRLRVPAVEVEGAFKNPEYLEQITAFEGVKVSDIALATGISSVNIRRELRQYQINPIQPHWGDIRGLWDLPDTYSEYRDLLKTRRIEWRNEQRQQREDEDRRVREEYETQRKRRAELRAQLVAAFPSWKRGADVDQRIYLHIGPPNSGKTHDALRLLAEANSGWYLAPLRLLAFEIFDRLNMRGVFCNLLTGEEHIPLPGAEITAATIEMFNPQASGDCIIIDEAQMLADPDRGWAWTRAIMEAQAPEIHIIGPGTARDLIEQLAAAAAIPIEVIEHERLTPLQVAEEPWSLKNLPPRTILVAFSRKMVLALKTELEQAKRSVSVVYGSLPPEVRRRQADRFADGDTEICVATDAVGMGLNLPADYVCFYEVEKFDGRDMRQLKAGEVHQIGGRAGRFGLSKAGEIGATNRKNLRLIRQLFDTPVEPLYKARVAPTVADLEMLPGSLAERLEQWASLQSIPEHLRKVIETADLGERIELARMLSDREVNKLGMEAAMRLINAPTRKSSRMFWRACADSILAQRPLPLPPSPPKQIDNTAHLETAEGCIACADVYLWLTSRNEFMGLGEDEVEVRAARKLLSTQIDDALLKRLSVVQQCAECRKILPRGYTFNICQSCFQRRRRQRNYR